MLALDFHGNAKATLHTKINAADPKVNLDARLTHLAVLRLADDSHHARKVLAAEWARPTAPHPELPRAAAAEARVAAFEQHRVWSLGHTNEAERRLVYRQLRDGWS